MKYKTVLINVYRVAIHVIFYNYATVGKGK